MVDRRVYLHLRLEELDGEVVPACAAAALEEVEEAGDVAVGPGVSRIRRRGHAVHRHGEPRRGRRKLAGQILDRLVVRLQPAIAAGGQPHADRARYRAARDLLVRRDGLLGLRRIGDIQLSPRSEDRQHPAGRHLEGRSLGAQAGRLQSPFSHSWLTGLSLFTLVAALRLCARRVAESVFVSFGFRRGVRRVAWGGPRGRGAGGAGGKDRGGWRGAGGRFPVRGAGGRRR